MVNLIERSEVIVPGPAEALAGLLGVALPDLDAGQGLPLLWHWLFLLERPAQAVLGPDGHPATDCIPSPPGPGYRRMYAGGRVQTFGSLRTGRVATRNSTVLSSVDKHGRTGQLTFVTVAHQISQDGRTLIAEEQDIVYRNEAEESQPHHGLAAEGLPRTKSISPLTQNDWLVTIDPVLLFRFSALTYNGHRIHYDRDYARDVEGYPGLLVHGPLQAIVMTEAARRMQDVTESVLFEYRLLAPLFDHQDLIASAVRDGFSTTTTVRDLAGRKTATGTLTTLT
jgi:3-methylfumaryl-CoA hydratase